MTRNALLQASLKRTDAPPSVWRMTLTVIGAMFGANDGSRRSDHPERDRCPR